MNLPLIPATIQYTQSGWQPLEIAIIDEAEIGLSVNGEAWLSFLCTPFQLEALMLGFLFNEGVIDSAEEVELIQVCEDQTHVDIWLKHAARKPAHWVRTSGCGEGASAASSPALPIHSSLRLDPQELLNCMEQLFQGQALYQQTRGLHCSALSDGSQVKQIAEDLGRHNTLDKLAGLMLLEPVDCSPRIVLTTGRVSTEMVQKAARLQAEAIISRTSPTRRSATLAEALGLVLIGYARRDQMNIYAHAERLGYFPAKRTP